LSSSLKRSWDKISEDYQRRMRIPTDDVYWGEFVPSETRCRVLGDVRGKRILEIGCGGAQNSIALWKWGADASGIDVSTKQILYAKRLARHEDAGVNLLVASMENLPFRDETFDIVMTAISLHYTLGFDTTVAEVNRVLVDGGFFTFSMTHPLFEGKLVSIRGKNTAIVIGDYFKRRVVRWTEKLPDGSTVRMYSYYRTLQDYFDALLKNGFAIERYLELERLKENDLHPLDREDISRSRQARRLYEFMKKVPCWIIIKARKGS